MVSRSAFERDGREIRFKPSGVYSELPNSMGYSGTLSYSDIFSVGGQNNLGVIVTLGSYRTDRYSIDADLAWNKVTPETNPELNLATFGENEYPIWGIEGTH